jgi:hypothetical protein
VRKTAESVKAEQAKYVALVAEWKAECVKKTLLLAEIKEKKAVSTTEDDKNAIKTLRQDLKILNISVKSLYNKKKTTKPAKKVPEKIAVATKLIRKVGILIENLRKKHDKTLVFQFSCDSGYSDSRLLLAATDSHLNYISVLKKAHKVTINGETITIKDWIETVYKPAEIAHYAAQKDFPENKKTLFSLRIRCRYEAMDQDVTFLAFRLTDSTKVNAIYSPNKNIFAKTLRHHWFARTQIEQFFKLLKHYMHIEETRPRTKHRLEYIILRFAFIAIQIQKFIRLLRRKMLLPPKSALGTLRTILATTPFIKEYLNGLFQDLLQTNKHIKS